MKISMAANALPRTVLRTPLLHRFLSKKVALLTFRGQKSGREYTVPIVYVRQGADVLVSTDHRWVRNLTPSGPVAIRLQGRAFRGTAVAAGAPSQSEEIVTALVRRPNYVRFAGIPTDETGAPDVAAAVKAGRVGVTIRIDDSPS